MIKKNHKEIPVQVVIENGERQVPHSGLGHSPLLTRSRQRLGTGRSAYGNTAGQNGQLGGAHTLDPSLHYS